MVLFAESASQPEDAGSAAGGGVRYHRSDATEASDAVQGIGLERRIGADRMSVLGADYKTMQSIGAQLPLQHAGHDGVLEQYEPAGAYAWANASEAERYLRLMAQAVEAGREQWIGHGAARTFRSGTWFRRTRVRRNRPRRRSRRARNRSRIPSPARP